MRLLVSLTFLFLSLASTAGDWSNDRDYLLVITSQRNAEVIADAARLFYQQHPERLDLSIQARSDVQFWQLSAEERVELISRSRGILGFGLYGPSVTNLVNLLNRSKKPQLLLNSDHRLVATSQFKGRRLFADLVQLREIAKELPGSDFEEDVKKQLNKYPLQAPWIVARSYWAAGGSFNTAQLYAWLFGALGEQISSIAAKPTEQLRWFYDGKIQDQMNDFRAQKSVMAVLDHTGGGRPADVRLLQALCEQAQNDYQLQCLAALAYWGEAGVLAAQQLLPLKEQLAAVIMLQDFVIGGGEGREAVTEILKQLNVPIIKAIKLRDRTAIERQLSSDGLAAEKVYYQVAMPELQGASQPLVIATAGQLSDDSLTGIRVQSVAAESSGINSLLSRVDRWRQLQRKSNAQKRIAIVYYNHPPGRHNIGADNLDVPASLWQILNQLSVAGYDTGSLPESQEQLLDMMQERGVNLPRNVAELAKMSSLITRMKPEKYRAWFNTLPVSVQQEMRQGPFGLLHEQLSAAIAADKPELAQDALDHTLEEMHHLLEGVDHQGRERALALLAQLEKCYLMAIKNNPLQKTTTAACMAQAPTIISALQSTGIEGLGGWGAPPGKVMTYNEDLLLPGITFGNIFIGPQPPRGWEINEELLHANLAFPPPHQYLAFYHFLRDQFKADALVHLGRHSTYEFLPRRSVGLAEDDYSRIVAGDLPGLYPYIVDGVGEGIQAKRRGLAVMVDHLTPPLASTPLYDELLQLRQLIESFEVSHGSGNDVVAARLVEQIREKVDVLELKEELAEAMSAELAVMGIGFEEVDDDMMVHEVGHYLTDLQERFMPLGLHIYGKDWQLEAVDMMLTSMLSKQDTQDLAEQYRDKLKQSPRAEMVALINGLAGGYVWPGQGNDPIRSPASLPTGRNFYALDSSLIPSRVAWQLGREMATSARSNNTQSADKSEALILWASDVVRDEGVMIAFGLDMLGLEPVWNSRGLVKGLKRQAIDQANPRVRRDIVFTTSGLFRDLYGQQMLLLNRATLMALDASADTIRRDHPALTLALMSALNDLGKEAIGGSESLHTNQLAAHWVTHARELMAQGASADRAGVVASLRVFGDAPGSYGAGINRLAERSGAWEKRDELAAVYMRRLGHSYTESDFGMPAQDAFKAALSSVENTYFGRSSNLYGLIDNNDAFDYLGGLSLSVEILTGAPPNNFVIDHADPKNIKTRPLGRALRQELRGRFLNPEWLQGQMEHDYAGARTMGSEFLEYLWGWQVTNPTLVGDWAWEEVKSVYIDDRYDLQLDEFLEEGHNAHVKSNMLAIMLVAISKGFWKADQQTIQQLAEQFAELVAINGLPGSGHTDPENPMLPWLQQYLSEQQWQAIVERIIGAMGSSGVTATTEKEIHRIAEIVLEVEPEDASSEVLSADDQISLQQQTEASATDISGQSWHWWLASSVLLFIAIGFYRGLLQARQNRPKN